LFFLLEQCLIQRLDLAPQAAPRVPLAGNPSSKTRLRRDAVAPLGNRPGRPDWNVDGAGAPQAAARLAAAFGGVAVREEVDDEVVDDEVVDDGEPRDPIWDAEATIWQKKCTRAALMVSASVPQPSPDCSKNCLLA